MSESILVGVYELVWFPSVLLAKLCLWTLYFLNYRFLLTSVGDSSLYFLMGFFWVVLFFDGGVRFWRSSSESEDSFTSSVYAIEYLGTGLIFLLDSTGSTWTSVCFLKDFLTWCSSGTDAGCFVESYFNWVSGS